MRNLKKIKYPSIGWNSILLFIFWFILISIQVIFIDVNYPGLIAFKKEIKTGSPLLSGFCDLLENFFMFEEMIYGVCSVVLVVFISMKATRRRFSYYITRKYRHSNLKDKNDCKFGSIIKSFSFSTLNRSQLAALYVIYTYDVLNIFLFIYTANYQLPNFYEKFSGVISDFGMQIVQVILFGIKFYPIMVVADLDPSKLIYSMTTLYLFIFWSFKFVNKAFCSKTKAMLVQSLRAMIYDINKKIKSNLEIKRKTSNVLLGLLSDNEDASQNYYNAIRYIIPNHIKNLFRSQHDGVQIFHLTTSPK